MLKKKMLILSAAAVVISTIAISTIVKADDEKDIKELSKNLNALTEKTGVGRYYKRDSAEANGHDDGHDYKDLSDPVPCKIVKSGSEYYSISFPTLKTSLGFSLGLGMGSHWDISEKEASYSESDGGYFIENKSGGGIGILENGNLLKISSFNSSGRYLHVYVATCSLNGKAPSARQSSRQM